MNNGWNNVQDNNSQKTYGVQAIIKPIPSVSIIQNYMGGPEQTDNPDDWRHLADTTVMYTANDKLSVMGNYDYGRDRVAGETVTWQGIGLYAKGQLSPSFALIPRYEYFDDVDGFTTTAAQKLQEFTLTAELKHSQGLIMRLEYRRDWTRPLSCHRSRFPRVGRPSVSSDRQRPFLRDEAWDGGIFRTRWRNPAGYSCPPPG